MAHGKHKASPQPKRRETGARGVQPVQAATSAQTASPVIQDAAIRGAIKTLLAQVPTLHQQPDLIREFHSIVGGLQRAEATREALGLDWQERISTGGLTSYAYPSVDGFRAYAAPTGSHPQGSTGSTWAGSSAPQGVPNAATLRKLAEDPWVAAAILDRKQRVCQAELVVAPDDETKPYDKKVQLAIEDILENPNEYRESWNTIAERVVDDILVLDRGCISKDVDLKRIPHGLYAENGAQIKIYPNWDGDPEKPRYLYEEPGSTVKIPLLNNQLICIQANEATWRFGRSPVQILYDTIQADLAASLSAAGIVSSKPPPHLIQFPKANQTTIDSLRARYEADIAGRRELWLVGGDEKVEVQPLVYSLKDNQWLEWQVWLARKICAVLQTSPQTLGITFDINRATAEVQQDVSEDQGLIPLLLLLERYLNREFLADFAPLGRNGRPNLKALNLRIYFPMVSELQRMLHAEQVIKTIRQAVPAAFPLLTPNMWLRMLGEEPLPKGGNTFWVMTTNGPMPWVSYDGETGDYGYAVPTGPLGTQDPAGGPNEDASTPGDGGNAGGDTGDDTPAPPASQGASGDQSAPAASSATDAAAKALQVFLVRQVHPLVPYRAPPDRRQPGKRWSSRLAKATAPPPASP